MLKAIINGNIITEQGILQHHAVVFNKNIVGVVPEGHLSQYQLSEKINAKGRYVSPGFIDLHIHGCSGFDVMDDDSQALDAISRKLLQTGVTSFLPTTMTMPFAKIKSSIERIRQGMEKSNGAEILGCHMEGPFIHEAFKGAQDGRYIMMPEFKKIEEYLDVIKMITIAPELAKDSSFIKDCVEKGIVVSIGHSNATYEQAITAIEAGVSHMTHTFNALPPLHHRCPGAIGAAIDSKVVCELIADNIHVHPAMQRLLLKLKGVDDIILITDAMRASMLGAGQYDLGGQTVIVERGEARLADGVIAGSVLSLNEAVRNFMRNTGLDLVNTIQMVTANPARQIGMTACKGSIENGKHADLVIFDESLVVYATFVGGRLLWEQQEGR